MNCYGDRNGHYRAPLTVSLVCSGQRDEFSSGAAGLVRGTEAGVCSATEHHW